ncbi:MAG: hypothetical protein HY340_00255 [Candidatus Kerfeldbacteria bacterium]|nr:hypothetical protein [Candidatus Kerfeldbacteria bacterium]
MAIAETVHIGDLHAICGVDKSRDHNRVYALRVVGEPSEAKQQAEIPAMFLDEISRIYDQLKVLGGGMKYDSIVLLTKSKDILLRLLQMTPAEQYRVAFWLRAYARGNRNSTTVITGDPDRTWLVSHFCYHTGEDALHIS